MSRDALDRFGAKVDRGADCWVWVGAKASGYGRIYWDGRVQPAHRVAYELLVGPIPAGRQLDHLCRNRACVRPTHLEPVTCRANLLRGVGQTARNAAVQACPQGHPYDAANTYWHDGARHCRKCRTVRVAPRNSAREPSRTEIVAQCSVCSTEFRYIRTVGGRARRFCSDDCRTADARRRAREHARRKRGDR